jgi:Fe-coproporphyrin III synthase
MFLTGATMSLLESSISHVKQTLNLDGDRRDLGFVQRVVRRRKLEALFLFVTSRCNSNCRTCFYHDRLNDDADLSFDELRRISETAPRFDKLWLSGGEPFMRKDLFEIIRMFVDQNGVKVINLPSNGLLPDRVERVVDQLLEQCPKLEIHLNFSLDGIGPTHDQVRGVPGGFDKTLQTLRRVKQRYAGQKKLIVNVASVITPDNYDELFDLGVYLLRHRLCAVQFLEVVRGDPKDPATKTLTPAQIQALHERFYPLFEEQARHLFEDFGAVGEQIAKRLFLGFLRFVHELQLSNLEGPSPWGMACTAGTTTLVLDHDGDFRSCEMRPAVGNIRDFGFDTAAVLRSRELNDEVQAIGGGERANCWCTHGCWIMSSMKFSPRTTLLRMPLAYWRSRRLHQEGFVLPAIDESRFASAAGPEAAAQGGGQA